MKWWLIKPKNEIHKSILQCIPTIICWQIWKNRCTARFEDKKISHWFISQEVISMINMIIYIHIPTLHLFDSWQVTYNRVENLKCATYLQVVLWHRPIVGWYKLNIDGYSKGNPGPAGGGNIIRDHNGKLICAFFES